MQHDAAKLTHILENIGTDKTDASIKFLKDEYGATTEQNDIRCAYFSLSCLGITRIERTARLALLEFIICIEGMLENADLAAA